MHYVKELYKKFTKIEFKHILRIQNEFTDALVTLSSMIQHPDKNYIDPIEIRIKDQHTCCFHVNEELDAYIPQMNGEVEASNKNIKRILRKMVDSHRQWHEKLPFVLYGYRTTMRTSTGATPYMLVYGTEAVTPAEVEIPSLRVIQEAKLGDAQWIRVRIASAFNKRVKLRQFMLGKLVLKKIFPHQEEAKGKFAPNWQGPYVVDRALSDGALILIEMDGRVNTNPINSDAIKRYYA
ncbi:uncharacterized protein [Nicotiana tomentosiformis]|uniref:uncharacterized protein n=1 Tax=Nicotiana tomentosiformis TaxID=4098 RepID=UPI00388CA32C